MKHLPNYVAVAALFYGSHAAALTADPAPTLADGVSRCRTIPADRDRLACFDRAAAAIDSGDSGTATARADRSGGFGMPARTASALPEGAESLESTVAKVARWQRDRVTVTLADGSVWRTTERMASDPAVGAAVRIRRAALGSYLARFDQGRGVRILRVR